MCREGDFEGGLWLLKATHENLITIGAQISVKSNFLCPGQRIMVYLFRYGQQNEPIRLQLRAPLL